jgi:hypothetical protein
MRHSQLLSVKSKVTAETAKLLTSVKNLHFLRVKVDFSRDFVDKLHQQLNFITSHYTLDTLGLHSRVIYSKICLIS